MGFSLAVDQAAVDRADIGGSDITLSRRFYRAHQLELMEQMASHDAAVGIVPFVSLKPPRSWRDVADGRADGWLEAAASKLGGIGAPVFLSLHHEPEDNHAGGGDTPAAWIAMHRRADRIFARYPRVTIVPVLMQWTFDPASGRDPTEWLMLDRSLLGVDVYNHWRTDRTGRWVEFDLLISRVRAFVPDTIPLIVPELGSAVDTLDLTRTSLWLRAAYDSALVNNVVGLAWFDSEYNNKKGDFRLRGDSARAMRDLLARPETVRWDETNS